MPDTLFAHAWLREEEKRPPSDLIIAWTEKQVMKIHLEKSKSSSVMCVLFSMILKHGGLRVLKQMRESR